MANKTLGERKMEWCGITGSWRHKNPYAKRDVERIVKEIIRKGDGIVTGGALGVDFYATNVVLKYGNPLTQLKIFLPVRMADYFEHYFYRYDQIPRRRIIEREDVENLTEQLRDVYTISFNSIHDKSRFSLAHKKSYMERNSKVIEASDKLYAFHIDNSEGVADAIEKARDKGIEVYVRRYEVDNISWIYKYHEGFNYEEFNIPKSRRRIRNRRLKRIPSKNSFKPTNWLR